MHILNLYLVSNFNPSQNYKSIGGSSSQIHLPIKTKRNHQSNASCIFLDEYSTITRHGRFFEMQQMSLGFYGCDLGSGPPKSCDPFVLVVSAMFKNKDFSLEIPQFAMGNRHWNNRCISWYIIELSHIFQNHVKLTERKRFYQWWLLPGRWIPAPVGQSLRSASWSLLKWWLLVGRPRYVSRGGETKR